MKVYQDLFIIVGRDKAPGLIKNLEVRLNNGWIRDLNDEEFRRKLFLPDREYYCFACTAKPDRKAARLGLTRRQTDDALYVSNIVPTEARKLTYDEYNSILKEFFDQFVKPACQQMGIESELTSGEQTIENWISPDAAKNLRQFSDAANRSVAHPLDQERWYKFLLSVHPEHENLDASRLERWLVEEEHWPEDEADHLASQYDFAMHFLDYKEGH